ncbi:hypothetical protein FRC03_010925 [Tulasnella sp. 419]|nr:hypothetical protein FRC02_011022 [Tulasnella sp. 418]KAG8966970.1 hypothetical protein FRC03_010925 [Tulasnella sp. 419]
MAAGLPDFSLITAGNSLPPDGYVRLLSSVIRNIDAILKPRNPATVFDPTAVFSFIDRHAADVAQTTISSSITHPKEDTDLPSSVTSKLRCIKLQTFLLAERLPKISLTIRLLQNLLLIVELPKESSIMVKILTSAFLMSEITASIKMEVIPEMTSLLASPYRARPRSPQSFISSSMRLSQVMKSWVRLQHNEVIQAFSQHSKFVLELAKSYGIYMWEVAEALGGVPPSSDANVPEWVEQWIEIKVGYLDVFHYIMDNLVENASIPDAAEWHDGSDVRAILVKLLSVMLDMHAELQPPVPIPHRNWLLNMSLLADYEHYYNLSARLNACQSETADSMVSFLITQLKDLIKPGIGGDSVGGLRYILKNAHLSTRYVRGRESGSKQADVTDKGTKDLELSITQVLGILPEETRDFVQAALLHPFFAGSSEKVISAILEGSAFPPELESLRHPEEQGAMVERRNIFDDEMDYSRLRFGKDRRDTADMMLQDKTAMEDLKAKIMHRVTEQSDGEEEAQVATTAFNDELDGVLRSKGIGIDEDVEEESDESKLEEDRLTTEQSKSLSNIETILELAYLKDSAIFDRESSVRRSKERHDLRLQTGWVDEQIEGWRIMLERNPLKEKILAKHEFSGNKPLGHEVPTGQHIPRGAGNSWEQSNRAGRDQPHGSDVSRGRGRGQGQGHVRGHVRGQGQERGRGRGQGQGRGRGRGEENYLHSNDPGHMSGRGRAWKERNKNAVRSRGHDQKMGRGAL